MKCSVNLECQVEWGPTAIAYHYGRIAVNRTMQIGKTVLYGYAVDRNGEKKMESGSVARSLTRRFHLIKPTFQVLYVQDGWAKGKLFLRYTS